MPTQSEIRDAMDSVGLREIEANQFTQLNADDGFCRGACLDWVRRVLQGRLVYDYARTGNAKGAKREARMREIQATLTGLVFSELTDLETEMERRRVNLAARVAGINSMEGDAQEAAIAAYRADQTKLNEELLAYGERAAMGPLAAGWSGVSSQLDDRTAATRGKSAATVKRSFSSIAPVRGSGRTDLETSAKVVEAIGKVMRELAVGSAAMFVFKPPSEVGHAIGVARSARAAALFDPSYGMYSGPDVERAIKGFTYLLNAVYPGSNQLEFTVFVKKAD